MKTLNPLPIAAFALCAVAAATASAAYVKPKMGGAQESAPMVMPNVKFDGTKLTVSGIVDDGGVQIAAVPVLRPLTPLDAFDPAQPWGVLGTKAYNLQYGWNIGTGSEPLPLGASIWIEATHATAGLETYERGTNIYTPIFGTGNSSTRWLWNGVMAHNAYAVPASTGNWEATYALYLGDATGTPITNYGGTSVTLSWTSVPEPATLGLAAICGVFGLRRRSKGRPR